MMNQISKSINNEKDQVKLKEIQTVKFEKKYNSTGPKSPSQLDKKLKERPDVEWNKENLGGKTQPS